MDRGSEVAIPFGAWRTLENAEISEDVLRIRKGRARVNTTAVGPPSIEGRIAFDGYGLIKAHSSLNPGNSTFTLECAVRLPKITLYGTDGMVYPLVFRGGVAARTIYGIYLQTTGGTLFLRVIFQKIDQTTNPATAPAATILSAAIPNAEGTVGNAALRRGGVAGATPALLELLVNGVVSASHTLGANEVLYGSDAAESNLPTGYGAGERNLLDLFVLNHTPDSGTLGTVVDTKTGADPRLAEVRFWSDARTDDELTTWGTTELNSTQLADAALVAYWPMKDGGGRFETNKKSGSSAGSCFLMPHTPPWTTSALDLQGRDHLAKVKYVKTYDRIASLDAAIAVKTWTWMFRFRTGNYMRNYIGDAATNDDRRMVLMQWGSNPLQPQGRLSILYDGTQQELVWESYHGANIYTIQGTTALVANTTYTAWIVRNGTTISLFIDGGTVSDGTVATLIATDNGVGTGTTEDILIGAGVASATNLTRFNFERFYYGRMDEVRLFARVIDAPARLRTFAADLSRSEIQGDPDLLLNIQFTEGVGNEAADVSKTANLALLTRLHDHFGTTQWSSTQPIRWANGFTTAQAAPVFNGLAAYTKKGATQETLIGIASGVAYEVGTSLTEQVGQVAEDDAPSATRAVSSAALEERLYIADGRNPIVAVDNGVVRPCGIRDLPASAVPGLNVAGPGELSGYYSYAVQIKSAFTGALSRPIKTAGVRFKNERAIVGFGTSSPTGSFLRFDGTDDYASIATNTVYNTQTWSLEFSVRPTNVLTERGEARGVRLLSGSNNSVVSGLGLSAAVTPVAHPAGEFTYEIRFNYVSVTPGLGDTILIHPKDTTATSVGSIRISAAGSGGNVNITAFIGNVVTTIASNVSIPSLASWVTLSVVRRNSGWEVYRDGGLVATSASNAPDSGLTAQPIVIGWDYNTGTSTNFATMEVGEFRVWNYARSAADILTKYQSEITATTDLDDLYVYWRFNEGSGGIVNNHSTLVSPVPPAGYVGASNGANPTLDTSPTRVTNLTVQQLIHREESANVVGMLNVDLTDVDSALRFRYRDSSNNTVTLFTSTGITNDKWYHVAWTRDGGSNEEKLYIDGLLVATASTSSHDIAPTTGTWRLGVTDPVIGRSFFKGDLDEIRFWNVVRTATQVADNLDREIDPIPASLIGYWKVNGVTTDSSGTANAITLPGGVNNPTFVQITGGQIPIGLEPLATARRIYRSVGTLPTTEVQEDLDRAQDTAEAGPWYLIREIEDNVTTQITDNTPDAELVILLNDTEAGNPPSGRVVSTFGDRLIVANTPTATSTAFVSAPGQVENFDIVGDAVTVEDGRSGHITSVVDMTGIAKQAFVFTENAIFSIQENGTRIEGIQLASGFGCVATLGAVRVDDTVYFWDRKGPMRFRYGSPEPIWLDIERAIQRLNPRQLTQIVAVHHYPRKQIHFIVPDGASQGTLNAVFKFDYMRNRWVGKDTGEVRSAIGVGALNLAQPTFPQVFLADNLGHVLAIDQANGDGIPGGQAATLTCRDSVSSSTATVVTLTTGGLTSAAYVNVTVIVRSAAGVEQTRTISANTASTVTVSTAFSPTPSAGDLVFIGPIAFAAETGWLDMNAEDEAPSVTRKRFEFVQIHFDNEGLSGGSLPIVLQTAVRDRGYYSVPAWDQSLTFSVQNAADTAGVVAENQPLSRFYIPNAYGRFLRLRVSGSRPSGWGIHQLVVEYQQIPGF